VLREDQMIDELPPSPGEEDDDECKVLTDCPAEYQSCTPTTGGWLACSGMGGGWGGVACEIGGCRGPAPRDKIKDWQVGSPSTSPVAALPLFRGLVSTTGGYKLDYDITSVLQNESTVAFPHPSIGGGSASHIVRLTMTNEGSTAPLSPSCEVLRLTPVADYTTIPKGSKKRYTGAGTPASPCSMPGEGVYELRYELDPSNVWFEEDEPNNNGWMRGKYRVR